MPARRVLAVCLQSGARQARRGEFTERAYLGGRLDLIQAEAVADVVAAKTPRGLAMALGQLEGGLSGLIATLRSTLLSLRTETEAAIDFPEDVDVLAARRAATSLVRTAREQIELLLENCAIGAAVRDGVSVALVGKPNVGKSSLMNALLMRDRSIVTTSPGTTRDAIEESVHIDGIPIRLVDTAGWRETEDDAERAGVERARAAAQGAALSVLVVDASLPPDEGDTAVAAALDGRASVVVANKVDLGRGARPSEFSGLFKGETAGEGDGGPRVLWVSALTGAGLKELRSALAEALLGPTHSSDALVSNLRHTDALRRVKERLLRVDTLLSERAPFELVGAELADAGAALGEITGETTPEEVLRHIFDRFCVGK